MQCKQMPCLSPGVQVHQPAEHIFTIHQAPATVNVAGLLAPADMRLAKALQCSDEA